MRIVQMAALAGVSPRSLRDYETVGLLRTTRTGSGQRVYALDSVDRVITIQHLLAAGLTTAAIRDVLPCLDAPAAERTGYLEQRLAIEAHRIERRQKNLTRQLDVLDNLLHAHRVDRPGPPPRHAIADLKLTDKGAIDQACGRPERP